MPQVTMIQPDGPAIRDRREHLGLTQKALGQKVKCSRAWISAIENGKPVSRLFVARIARALGGEPGQFVIQPDTEKAA